MCVHCIDCVCVCMCVCLYVFVCDCVCVCVCKNEDVCVCVFVYVEKVSLKKGVRSRFMTRVSGVTRDVERDV